MAEGASDPATPRSRPRLGVSGCLLGQRVRHDGGHKRDRFLVETLGAHVEFVPRCPEAAIGLGTPREAIRLVRTPDGVEARGVRSGTALGARLAACGEAQARDLAGLCGYVFKSRSPSCGLWRVPRHGAAGGRADRGGRGLYAAALTAALPWLPVEEEGRLDDPARRESFLVRVFALHRLRRTVLAAPTPRALVDYHAAHKLLVLAHGAAAYRRLGRLVAGAGSGPLAPLLEAYRDGLMAALARPATVPRHVNVLEHLLGHLRGRLDPAEGARLREDVEAFRDGRLAPVAMRRLLRHHFRRHPDPWVLRQAYLRPYPDELAAGPPVPASARRWASVAPRSAPSR